MRDNDINNIYGPTNGPTDGPTNGPTNRFERRRYTPLVMLLSLLVLVTSPALAQDEGAPAMSPTEFVQSQANEVIEIINRDVERGSEAFTQRQNDLKAAVRDFLDYRELVRRALGDHWDDRTEEEQTAFVELMTRLIETNYTVKMGNSRAQGEYQVTYDDELIRGQNARVMGTVTYDDELVMVEIMLLQRENGWIVWDVVTDDVSIQETYAESFDEIIYEDGWGELVRKVEERLAELEAELAEQTGQTAADTAAGDEVGDGDGESEAGGDGAADSEEGAGGAATASDDGDGVEASND